MRSLAITALLVGCYAPTPQPGASCASSPCPTGLVCSPATQTCELAAIDAAEAIDDTAIDAANIDGLVDGPFDGPPDTPPPPIPTLHQTAHAHSSSAATLSVTFVDPPIAGRMIVMTGGNIGGPLETVSGGGVVTWRRSARSLVFQNVETWYGETNGINDPVVIDFPNGTGSTTMQISEWSGVMANGPVSGRSNDGDTSPATVDGPNVPNGGDLVIFAVANIQPNTFGAIGPGVWTPVDIYSNSETSQGTWYQLPATPGTTRPTVDVSAFAWDANVTVFRAD